MKKYAAISTGGYISRHGVSCLHRDLRAQKRARARLVPRPCFVDLADSEEVYDLLAMIIEPPPQIITGEEALKQGSAL
jgi:hypothetical protein